MKNLAIASLVFLWIIGGAATAQTTGSIQGNVTDPSGAAILGAVITAEGADGKPRTTVSDGEGAFKISSLPPA